MIGTMRDWASVNDIAMRTVQVIYPKALDIWRMNSLQHGWHYFHTVLKSQLLWQSRVARSVKSPSKHDSVQVGKWSIKLLEFFGNVEPFLTKNNDLGPHSCTRMLSLLQDSVRKTTFMAEMTATVDTGREFVKTTYSMKEMNLLCLNAMN